MMETDTVVGSSIRVTVDRDPLAAGLQRVSRAAGSRGSVEDLGGVIFVPLVSEAAEEGTRNGRSGTGS